MIPYQVEAKMTTEGVLDLQETFLYSKVESTGVAQRWIR
jgi:hypothetical protein